WEKSDPNAKLHRLSWESVLSEHYRRLQLNRRRTIRKRILSYSAAATLILALSISALLSIFDDGTKIYKSGNGQVKEIALNDGTKISLNANSTLIWKKGWKKSGVREVELQGEANFEVVRLEDPIPFKVSTSDLTINVLGTTFNVSKRRESTEVLLKEGSIELLLNEGVSANESVTKSKILLIPNEFVSYSANEEKLVKKRIDDSEYLVGWKDGVLSYQNLPLDEMIQNLEDIYGVKIEVRESSFLERRFDFNIPYRNWETVKEMLEVMLSIKIVEIEKESYKIIPNYHKP
ncbi:MAG: FecR domain-containing protein, partial [Bacteroidales bacterium]